MGMSRAGGDGVTIMMGLRTAATEHQGRLSRVAGGIERVFVRHRGRLPYLHVAMFVVFVVLILAPPLLPILPQQAGPLDHLVPFANVALWGL